jgi:rubrerythrin
MKTGGDHMNNLEFAIAMEKDGEKYYTEQAEIYKASSLHRVFLNLAKDEHNHAEILENRFNRKAYDLTESTINTNLFTDIGVFRSEIRSNPTQLDVYQVVLDRERASIDLYAKMHFEAKDEKDKVLYEFLVLQETKHHLLFDELVKIVSRPEEWVEDAEFGVREEY